MEHGKKRKHKVFIGEGGPHGFAFGPGDFGHKFKKFAKAMGDDCCPGEFSFGKGFSFGHGVRQIIKEDTLNVIIHAPGADKDSIKLRAKPDKLTFTWKLRQDLADHFLNLPHILQ